MFARRSIAMLGCFLLALSLVSLCAVPAEAATWTKIADNGVTNTNNIEMGPGVVYKGMQTIFSTPITGIVQPPGDISMYTYNGSTFAQVGPDSFNNPNIKGTQPTAIYNDKLYIGTANGTDGG